MVLKPLPGLFYDLQFGLSQVPKNLDFLTHTTEGTISWLLATPGIKYSPSLYGVHVVCEHPPRHTQLNAIDKRKKEKLRKKLCMKKKFLTPPTGFEPTDPKNYSFDRQEP